MRVSEFWSDRNLDELLARRALGAHATYLRKLPPSGLFPEADLIPIRKRLPRSWIVAARRALVERDGYVCRQCGFRPLLGEHLDAWVFRYGFMLDVDHIEALSLNGAHSMENLQLLCRECHNSKTGRDRAAVYQAAREARERLRLAA